MLRGPEGPVLIGGRLDREPQDAVVHEVVADDLALTSVLYICKQRRLLKPLARKRGNDDDGGGLVVNVLAFYFDDPSSNPAEVLRFLGRINKRGPFKKY